ncbi:hypothetical protein H7F15_00480 [Pontibacter sp. Tf4]|uniref:hypothetical protein n=1 Tax=Pontibacter sp. Tf4 TaxID=2761620 RepID=UPI0016282F60|nr:hypothetical protein [Pontibacter sp. Tf4]MBB6609500.1 hypothetical protein [Pontibacter sp. Tf4]
MKTLSLSFILTLSTLAAVAQERVDSTEVQRQIEYATAPPYKLAIGVRLLNFAGDFDMGVNAKYFIGKQSALEASVSKVIFNNNAYQLALMYERHSKLLNSNHFLLYYGGGAGLLHITKEGWGSFYGEEPKPTTQVGAGFVIGTEIGLGKIPLAFSADFRGIYYLKPNRQGGFTNVANGTLGIKYRFGMPRR